MRHVAGHTRGGFGDDQPTPFLPGLTGSAGGAPLGLDPAAYLVAQVNRFAQPGTPANLRVAPVPFEVATGKVGDAAAVGAMFVLQLRALDAATSTLDPNAGAVLAEAAANLANATAYVNARVAQVTPVIQGYADAKGLPKASVLEAVAMTTWLVLGGAAVLAYLVLRSKKGVRRGR